jgi:hypothetical protein
MVSIKIGDSAKKQTGPEGIRAFRAGFFFRD